MTIQTQFILDDKGKKIGVIIPIEDYNQNVKPAKLIDEDSNKEILSNIKKGLEEVKLIKNGSLKSRPIKELLNEL